MLFFIPTYCIWQLMARSWGVNINNLWSDPGATPCRPKKLEGIKHESSNVGMIKPSLLMKNKTGLNPCLMVDIHSWCEVSNRHHTSMYPLWRLAPLLRTIQLYFCFNQKKDLTLCTTLMTNWKYQYEKFFPHTLTYCSIFKYAMSLM